MNLKTKILKLLQDEGCLNGHEICRLLNGFDKHNFRICHLSFDEKPMRQKSKKGRPCRGDELKCKYHWSKVHATLKRMKIPSVKMLWWDSGARHHREIDLFRFWFIDRYEFKSRILKQTLLPYLEVSS